MGIIEGSKGGETLARAFGKLNYYGNNEYKGFENKKGVARLLYKEGKLRWSFTGEGREIITSPLKHLVVTGRCIQGVTIHNSSFSAEMYEECGIWNYPGLMIAIGYHKGWLISSTSRKIKVGKEPTAVSLEIVVDPKDNSRGDISLNIGETGEGQTYLLTPEYYEYSPQVLESVDGDCYEYYVLTIKTHNNTYSIALA